MKILFGFFSISIIVIFNKNIGSLDKNKNINIVVNLFPRLFNSNKSTYFLFDGALSVLVEIIFKFERPHILRNVSDK